MYTGMKLALAVAPLLLAARAIDVPMACKAMCSPIDDLDRRCDARDGPNEKAEETKCICADTTVVRTIFPLCLDCLRQNPAQRQGDDDDAEDIMGKPSIPSHWPCVALHGHSWKRQFLT